jgi:type IV pilus assembly protein PilB
MKSETKPKLGEILVKSGAISLRDLEIFLREQEELKDERGYQTRLGTLLLEHQLVNEETLALAFAEQQSIEYQDLTHYQPDLGILEKIPFSILNNFTFIPLFMDSQRLIIAIHDPTDTFLFDMLFKALGVQIEFNSASRSTLNLKHKECLRALQESGKVNREFDVDFDQYRLIADQEKKNTEPKEKAEVSLKNTVDKKSIDEILREAFLTLKATALEICPEGNHFDINVKRCGLWTYLGTINEETFKVHQVRVHQLAQTDPTDSALFQAFFEFAIDDETTLSLTLLQFQGVHSTALLFETYSHEQREIDLKHFGLLTRDYERLSALDLSAKGAWILGGAATGKSSFFHALLGQKQFSHLRTVCFESKQRDPSSSIANLNLDEERQELQPLGILQASSVDLVGLDELATNEISIYLRLLGEKPILLTSPGGAIFPTLARLEKEGESLGFIMDHFQFMIQLKLVPSLCPYCIEPQRPHPDDLKRLGLKPETLRKPNFYISQGCEYCSEKGFTDYTLVYELLFLTPPVLRILQENPLGNETAQHLLKTGSLVSINQVAREKLYRGRISLQTYVQVLQKKI